MSIHVWNRLARFRRDESGSASIEALFWIPMFFAILVLGVEVCLITSKQSMVMRVVQDGNRAFALGRLEPEAVDTYVTNALAAISPKADVTTTRFSLPNVPEAKGLLTTVEMPASDLSPFGVLPNFTGMKIFVSSQHVREF